MKLIIGLYFASYFGGVAAAAQSPLPLSNVADVPLTGNTTRWDYASIDDRTGLLYLAHLGDSTVTVFDTKTNHVVADIHAIKDVHGVLAIPELGRVYASATGSNEIVAIDATTLAIIARIPAGDYPDGIAYVPNQHKIYVSDEHGGTDTVIDTQSNTRVATIKVGREVGNTQYDPVSNHIFVNEQVRNQLVEIDPTTDKIVRRIELPGASGSHGLYIDVPSRLAYIACEGNATLLELNLDSKSIVSKFKVGGDPDVLAFDQSLGWLYVAGEEGIVSIFKVQNGKLTKIGEGFLGPDAHVVTVDQITHRAYFPLKDVNGQSVLRIVSPRTK